MKDPIRNAPDGTFVRACARCGGVLPDASRHELCPDCVALAALPWEDSESSREGEPVDPFDAFFRAPEYSRGFHDRYDIRCLVGRGGQGAVYEAFDDVLQRKVALKVLECERDLGPDAIVSFWRGVQAMTRLQHSAILPLLDVGYDSLGRPFFTTTLMEDFTFHDVIASIHGGRKEGWTLLRGLSLIIRICEAIEYAHSQGVIHCDLKPEHIFVGPLGELQIGDWGAARFKSGANAQFPTSSVWLSKHYSAPELRQGGAKAAQPTVDIHSLGAMLFELCTGRPPALAAESGQPQRLRALNTSISARLARIAETALDPEPSRRFQSVRDLKAALQDVLDRGEPGVFDLRIVERVKLWAKHHKTEAVLSVLLAGALTGAVYFKYTQFQSRAYQAQAEAREAQAEAARRYATQIAALNQARLDRLRGRWRDSLAQLDRAETAGYSDTVDLALRRLEIAYATGDNRLRDAEIERLYRTTDYGIHRGLALLRLGEFELFDEQTFERGVARVKEALSHPLSPSQKAFANGLIAESTGAALASFREAIRLDPLNGNAHRQAFGLELLTGQHAEAQDHLALFSSFFQEDPTTDFIQAATLFARGRHEEAQTQLDKLEGRYDAGALQVLRTGFSLVSALTRFDNIDALIRNDPPDLTGVASALLAVTRTLRPAETNSPSFRQPNLPCVRNTIRPLRALLFEKGGGFRSMLSIMAFAVDPKRLEDIYTALLETIRLHPEGCMLVSAASILERMALKPGEDTRTRLAQIGELLERAAEAPMMYPPMRRSVHFRAAETQCLLDRMAEGSEQAARARCASHIRWFLGFARQPDGPEAKPSELEYLKYWEFAFAIREQGLAHEVLDQLEAAQGRSPQSIRARARLHEAAGSFGPALTILDELLARDPNDAWAKQRRQALVGRLADLANRYLDPAN